MRIAVERAPPDSSQAVVKDFETLRFVGSLPSYEFDCRNALANCVRGQMAEESTTDPLARISPVHRPNCEELRSLIAKATSDC